MAATSSIKLLPHEILDKANAYKVHNKRIEYLKQKHIQDSFELGTILQGNFHPQISFDLPEGAPPFKRDSSPAGTEDVSQRKVYNKLGYLLKGSAVAAIKKERLFLEILESVNGKDADLVIAMKDKKLQELYPTITLEVVKEAFPKLLEPFKKR